ncbi:anthranilate phosphoribosyltransferase [Candidatus Venteria ishoeyi]|uniref:Anthranilate phosphoribosyltransferase n=1 Tax=Candidatus Venteria ishoeyi TaxID=1899563 RepID=A0A1H6FE39_9GAMM|nr:anthranilate phosphoribosyltransferase [Candidatus Venteria ishoeyi]SEH07284.1 Anthranilate phosphoribosyltransferase [Candidatus Venteria ishoeyi]
MTEQVQIQAQARQLMHSIIQRIATGPDLSKDISQEEARQAMYAITQGWIDPVQTAIFFIALRMKRETEAENKGVLSGIKDSSQIVITAVDEVVDIADPYNGYNRSLPASPFLPAVLAACGIPAVSHGMETVSPKFGVTHRQVLRAAGVSVDLSPQQAAERLTDEGWAYVDQKAFCPGLHDLTDFRRKMIKRSVITAVEVLVGPLRGKQKTHLVTGYVHKPYSAVYAYLARHSGFDSALLIRGVEGGVIPSLRQAGKCFYYHGDEDLQEFDMQPGMLDIQQAVRAAQIPDNISEALEATKDEVALAQDRESIAKAAAKTGIAALEGTAGPTRDGLIYTGALCLWHLKKQNNLQDAATQIRQVLDNGQARERLQ